MRFFIAQHPKASSAALWNVFEENLTRLDQKQSSDADVARKLKSIQDMEREAEMKVMIWFFASVNEREHSLPCQIHDLEREITAAKHSSSLAPVNPLMEERNALVAELERIRTAKKHSEHNEVSGPITNVKISPYDL